MENIKNQKILSKVEELVDLIKKSSTYEYYIKLKGAMENDANLMKNIDTVKSLQKELVKKQFNKEDTKDIENVLKKTEIFLEQHSLYQEYLTYQEELDETFQNVKFVLEDTIRKQIEE